MDAIIGKQIHSRRVQLGLSQDELALALGTTQATVSRYESGKREPNISFLRLTAEVLQVKVSVLLGEV